MLRVQSLPTVLPEYFITSDKILEIRSAYSMTLLLEHAASSDPDPKIRERKLVHARVLGHLLREAPSMHASENVANQVNSCQDNDQLDALGEMYFLHYICTFRIRKDEDTGSESSSSPPVRVSFETKRELVEHILRTNGEPSQSSEEAERRALVRDGFRCVLTGDYNYLSPDQSTELDQEVLDSGAATSATECAHIFPQSIAMTSGSGAKHEYDAPIWTIMTDFGFGDLPGKLVGNGIHTLENVMTLCTSFRIFFETLEVWLEAVDDRDNTYAIRSRNPQALLRSRGNPLPNPITLTSQHPDLPLPNRTFLAIHAACCRIGDLSGATRYINNTQYDMENST